MKKLLSIFLSALMLWIISFQTACIGAFNLTENYWEWNRGIGKWPGAVLFFFLGGIITSITLFVDILILNLIEFWTGTNPMSMNPGDMEKQLVMGSDGIMYEVVATQNRFDIYQLDGPNKGEIKSIVYTPETKAWSYQDATHNIKLAQMSNNGATIQVFAKNGQVAVVPTNINDKAKIASIVEDQLDVDLALIK